MNTSFAGVVEEVKQLSTDEKQELRSLLDQYLVEERRDAIVTAGEESRQRVVNDELRFSCDVDELMQNLDH